MYTDVCFSVESIVFRCHSRSQVYLESAVTSLHVFTGNSDNDSHLIKTIMHFLHLENMLHITHLERGCKLHKGKNKCKSYESEITVQ